MAAFASVGYSANRQSKAPRQQMTGIEAEIYAFGSKTKLLSSSSAPISKPNASATSTAMRPLRYHIRWTDPKVSSTSFIVILVNLYELDKFGVVAHRSFRMGPVLRAVIALGIASFRSRAALQLEVLALRHQMCVLQRSVKRPKLNG
jgi:hypothetical protein